MNRYCQRPCDCRCHTVEIPTSWELPILYCDNCGRPSGLPRKPLEPELDSPRFDPRKKP